jgi:phosphoadenosine phosphosulfate reductase
MALIHMIAEDYPDLWQGWTGRLAGWQEAQGLPPEWITEGRWRLKEGSSNDADSHY